MFNVHFHATYLSMSSSWLGALLKYDVLPWASGLVCTFSMTRPPLTWSHYKFMIGGLLLVTIRLLPLLCISHNHVWMNCLLRSISEHELVDFQVQQDNNRFTLISENELAHCKFIPLKIAICSVHKETFRRSSFFYF